MADEKPPVTVAPASETVTPVPEDEESDILDLPWGRGFETSQANDLCRRERPNIVLFAGTAKSGKTTLLSSLSLLFQKSPFAEHCFAGSRTLVGFEERNYYVEAISGGRKPTMERTKFTEILHLRVRDQDVSMPTVSLILCDVSGEDFREAKDSIEGCKRLSIISRADSFVLLIDGEKLADPTSKQRAKNDAVNLLRSCVDAGMLGSQSNVDVLLTKWDIVAKSNDQALLKFCEHVEETIVRMFGNSFAELKVHRVAAHPHTKDLSLGHGLKDVFLAWIRRCTKDVAFNYDVPNDQPVGTEYDRYSWTRRTDTVNVTQEK